MNFDELLSVARAANRKEDVSVGKNFLVAHADSFAWVPNDSIDAIITDPPFNIARDTNFHTYAKNTINSFRFDKDKGWDSHGESDFIRLLGEWSAEFERVLKKGGSFAIFCADEYLSDLIRELKRVGLKPRRTLTWRKPNAVPVNRKHMMMSACEYIVTGVKGSRAIFNSDVDGSELPVYSPQEIVSLADKVSVVIELEMRKTIEGLAGRKSKAELETLIEQTLKEIAAKTAQRATKIYRSSESQAELCIPNFVNFNSKSGNRIHPTEKPVDLLLYLTELFTSPGDTILDPFSGSGSMGEASLVAGRNAILVEQDKEFFDKSIRRLLTKEEQAASRIF